MCMKSRVKEGNVLVNDTRRNWNVLRLVTEILKLAWRGDLLKTCQEAFRVMKDVVMKWSSTSPRWCKKPGSEGLRDDMSVIRNSLTNYALAEGGSEMLV